MALDLRYIPLFYLWDVFTDKDTGDFLRNGYLKFWRDVSRTTGKEVFQITGSPPNYSYISYGFLDTDGGWRVDLNDQGALDSIIYAFPYDVDGNIDLYYVECFSAEDVPQFTREGIPNTGAIIPNGEEVTVNFVPNPQFLLHTNLPAIGILEVGEIRAPITQIAYGGWSFERPTSSSARDFVTFVRFGSDVSSPEKSPRYAARVRCESSFSGDTFKDVCLKFNDVNKFSYSANQFTFAFWGQVNSGSATMVSIVLKKNYGTGGSSPDEVVLGTVTIGTSYALNYLPFSFGDNSTKTIGTLNDDYLQLCIRFPVNGIFDISVVDFNLAEGNIASPSLPYTTNSQMMYRSLSGFTNIPDYNSNDLYLPLRLTPTGLEFDHSEVGNVVAGTTPLVPIGYLKCDGSQYETAKYSPDGIPYSRLQSLYYNRNIIVGDKSPRYGTGKQFLTSYWVTGSIIGVLRIVNNTMGTATDCSDGAVPTGFTFSNIYDGSVNTSSLGLSYNGNSLFIWCNTIGTTIEYINPQTSGFTVQQLRSSAPGATSSQSMKPLATVQVLAAAGLAGKFFTFSNTTTKYYLWYTVDGAGTDPAPAGYTGIKVNLKSTYLISDVAQITADAISGYKQTQVNSVAGSVMTPGCYFNLSTTTQTYYVWYTLDGVGTDPMLAGKIPIQSNISSSWTNAEVGLQTSTDINSKYFAVPDLRGMFLRGQDDGAGIDTDINQRWSYYNDPLVGDLIGTFQLDQILQVSLLQQAFNAAAGGDTLTVIGGTLSNADMLPAGGSESRPINANVNWLVKY